MTRLSPPLSLRGILLLDAATCTAMGGVLVLASDLVAAVTALPSALLFAAGLVLFPVAAFLAFAGTRDPAAPALVWLAILGNLLWVAASLVLAFSGLVPVNALGVAFLLVQAAAVALLSAMELLALRGRPLNPVRLGDFS